MTDGDAPGPVQSEYSTHHSDYTAPRGYYTFKAERRNGLVLRMILSGGVEYIFDTAFMFPAGPWAGSDPRPWGRSAGHIEIRRAGA